MNASIGTWNHVKGAATRGQMVSQNRRVPPDLIAIHSRPRVPLAAVAQIDFETDKASSRKTRQGCSIVPALHLHGGLWRPSPAIQLWINHAECEYLPQGRKKKTPMTVCVCEGDRQKVTSYVTARTEFPGNLLEEASEQFLVAVATFCRAPESFGVCAAPPRTRKKKKIMQYCHGPVYMDDVRTF